MVVGEGLLEGRRVFVAAQEGRFMGGTFAEVSGAKIVGVLRAAREAGVAVVLMLDTGGVRLQEANAGELAVSETIRAICEARAAGCAVVALVGGRAGAFGGGGIVTACCGGIAISVHGRTGVTGPEVIETNKGVEEFDSRDRALVWRVTGGRTRVLLGGADLYVRDAVGAFREAAVALLGRDAGFGRERLRAEGERLRTRVAAFGTARDSTEIWAARGVPAEVADLTETAFEGLLEAGDAAR